MALTLTFSSLDVFPQLQVVVHTPPSTWDNTLRLFLPGKFLQTLRPLRNLPQNRFSQVSLPLCSAQHFAHT